MTPVRISVDVLGKNKNLACDGEETLGASNNNKLGKKEARKFFFQSYSQLLVMDPFLFFVDEKA